MNKASRWKPKRRKIQHPKDVSALEINEVRSGFIEKTKTCLQKTQRDDLTPSNISERTVSVFQTSASATLPDKSKKESIRLWRDDNE
jgi:hypothetical protein